MRVGRPIGSPVPLTTFYGRERELDALQRLIATNRLITLTGPGGSGKTRLAGEFAASAAAEFPDGIFFVPLASLTEAELVPAEIAHWLEVQVPAGQPPLNAVAAALRNHQALLVLDNFEHLLAAARLIGELLRATTRLRVLATSRARLRISGEQELEVPPLPVPRDEEPVERAAASVSVRLFVDRATSVDPRFSVDAESLADVARIVRRLDGLPLAIELAAARVKALPPAAMLPLLDHSLPLLVGGPRDAPERQRTLRATIEWSYDRLDAEAKRLLAICAVFRGGFELSALSAVSERSAAQTANVLQELVDQSLVHVAPAPRPRIAMLETVREFAAGRLRHIAEASEVGEAHAAFVLALCEEAASYLSGPEVKSWLERLDLEVGNIRAALGWFEGHDPVRGLRLAAALWEFWERRGYFAEGRSRLRTALELAGEPTVERIRALTAAGQLAIDQGDLKDAAGVFTEALALSAELQHPPAEAMALIWSARIWLFQGQWDDARPYLDRAARMLASKDDPIAEARLRHLQGLAEYHSGHLEVARQLFETNLEHCRRIGFRSLQASTESQLGAVLADAGDLEAGRAAMQSALTTALDIGDRWMIHLLLVSLAVLAGASGRPQATMRLAGAASAIADIHHSRLPQTWLARLETWMESAQKSLGSAAGSLLAEGRKMTPEEVLAAASSIGLAAAADASSADPLRPLTRRQREVARLVAEGRSNRDIAATLVVSERTAEYHVQQILNSLGFSSRAQIAAWYAQRS